MLSCTPRERKLRFCMGWSSLFRYVAVRPFAGRAPVACLVAVVFALTLSSCNYLPRPQIIGGEHLYAKDELPQEVGRDYLLSPGDSVEIIYQFSTDLQAQYRLAIGDQVRVEFYDYPALDRTLDIRPDGRVTLPYKGDIIAVGLTPTELTDKVNHSYSDFLRYPRATVTLIRYGQQLRDLKESIRTNDRGMSRLVRINPDGKITLPLIPEPIMAAGITIEHLQHKVNDNYHPIIPSMATTASLLEATGNIVYIFGAVKNPNFYQLRGPVTSMQLVAMAGGLTEEAKAETTLWVTRSEDKHPVGRILDLSNVIRSGNAGADVMLQQGDVIYIPYTLLSEAAMVSDLIWRIIPSKMAFNYAVPPL